MGIARECGRRAAKKARQAIAEVIGGSVILLLGIILSSVTITYGAGAPVRPLTEGLILIGLGGALWIAGAVRYLRAALARGYEDDSI